MSDRAPDYSDKTDESRPATRAPAPAPTLEPNEARGAVTQHNVRYVLGISLAVVVVLFVVIYFAFAVGAPPSPPIAA